MRRTLSLAVLFAALLAFAMERRASISASSTQLPDGPKYTNDGKLARPASYRKWVFLSSGYGMSYSEKASDDPDHLMFTNVFVPPADYDYFLQHGDWPQKTMFVLEIYGSQSKGSINQRGHFQTEPMGLDIEVKDPARFPEKWGYFAFDNTQSSSEAIAPAKNDCWKCHDQNAAVEHSFVQFYPQLLAIAREKKTVKHGVVLP